MFSLYMRVPTVELSCFDSLPSIQSAIGFRIHNNMQYLDVTDSKQQKYAPSALLGAYDCFLSSVSTKLPCARPKK